VTKHRVGNEASAQQGRIGRAEDRIIAAVVPQRIMN